MKKALYTTKTDSGLQCVLCPHNCIIKPNKHGICKVRKNNGKEIVTEVYDKVSALHVDPIEKKPLYHFYPGSNILSVGSIGCNLKCKFCQNWEISQASYEDYNSLNPVSVDKIIQLARNESNNIGISYTYNEPTVWYEFMLDIAKNAKKNSFKNVMVTNGFINKGPLTELLLYIDAFSVDLKAFNEEFYKRETLSSLEPVKNTIKTIAQSDKFLEITNLIIPGLNDNKQEFSEMIKWLKNECGENTVLHISRYFPHYKMNIHKTPEQTLLGFYEIARAELNYVYLGNILTSKGQNTYCPECNQLAINRLGYSIKLPGIDEYGNCTNCNTNIIKHI